MTGNPWDQDDGLDGDDFVEGIDDEDEELGVDFHAAPVEDDDAPVEPVSHGRGPLATRTPTQALRKRPLPPGMTGKPKKFRIRAMSERMAARSPHVSSILITRTDGSQVLLVKGGR